MVENVLEMVKKNITNLELKAYMEKNNHIFNLIDNFIIKYETSSRLTDNKKSIIDADLMILEKELKNVVNVVDCTYIENDKVVIRVSNKKIREGRFRDFDADTLPQIKVILKEKSQRNFISNLTVEYNIFSPKIEMSNSKTRFQFEGETYGGFISHTNHKHVHSGDGLGMINTFNYPKKYNSQDIKVNMTMNYGADQIYIKDIITPFKLDNKEVLEFNNFLNSNFNAFSRYLENKENKNCLNDAVELLKLVSDTDNRIIKEFLKSNDYSGIRLFENDYLSFKKSKLGLFSKLFKKG